MKKLSLVALISTAAMFFACGDDSSSGAKDNVVKDSVGRTVYNDMQSALEAPCSEANKCEVIIMNDPIAQDTLQCNGSNFMSLNGKDNLPVCASAAPASSDAAAPASSDAAAPASSDAAAPASSSSDVAAPASSDAGIVSSSGTSATPAGEIFACMMDVAMTIGSGAEAMSFSTKSCFEIAATDDYAATLKEKCVNDEGGADGMKISQKASSVASCPEGFKLKCTGSAGNTVYLYDDDASCDDVE